jgi:hypothetical protein
VNNGGGGAIDLLLLMLLGTSAVLAGLRRLRVR